MDLGINGRTAIVCAASKGLGKACAMQLAKEGVNVVISARTKADIEATAEEIRAKSDEKMLQLGPVLERLHDELLDPLIDRTFDIMLRRGLLPPIPKALVEAAAKRGAELRLALTRMVPGYELLKEVRGKGLMIGIEFGPPKSLRLKASWTMLESANKGLFCQLITIPLFLQVSLRAAEDRLFRLQHPEPEALVVPT